MGKLNRTPRSGKWRTFAVRFASRNTIVVTSAIIVVGVFSGLAVAICCGQITDFVINVTASLAAAFAYNIPRAVHRFGNHLRS
jgi:hypothetical protein